MDEKKKELLQSIGVYFLGYYNNDYKKTEKILLNMMISKVEIADDEITFVLGRPGILIGPRGMHVDNLTKKLDMKIKIVEDMESVYDYLIPYCPWDY